MNQITEQQLVQYWAAHSATRSSHPGEKRPLQAFICTCCHQTVQQQWRSQTIIPHNTHRPIYPQCSVHSRHSPHLSLSIVSASLLDCLYTLPYFLIYFCYILYCIIQYHIVVDILFYSMLYCSTI